MESVLVVAPDASTPPSRRRAHFTGQVDSRFEVLRLGEWRSLLEASAQCDVRAAQARCRRRSRQVDEVEQRAIRAETLIHLGELSHARQVLEGAELAPGNQPTLDALQDEERRPPLPRGALPPDLVHHMPIRPFQLDEHIFSRNFRSSRRGAAAGPDHGTHAQFVGRCEGIAFILLDGRAVGTSESASCHCEPHPHGEIDSTRKACEVRGIIAGDVVRRLVARTVSQQLAPAVERATNMR